MLDTLDLDYYVKLGKSYRRINRTPLRRTLWVAVPILMIALLIWLNYKDTPGAVYTLENGAWQEVDVPFSGIPIGIAHSSTGLTWVSTDIPDGIHRFDGNRWTSFSADDYGADTKGTLYAFDTNGDELWLAVNGSISHYADDRWTTYENVYDYNPRVDLLKIVASDEGVLLTIDRRDGTQLFQFEDGTWKLIDPVTTLHMSPSRPEYGATPYVFEDADGTLWMYYLGVYRLENGEWRQIRSILDTSAYVLAMSSEGVIVNGASSFGVFPFDGNPDIVPYPEETANSVPPYRFDTIDTLPDGLIFSTPSNDLWHLTYDGRWDALPRLDAPYSVSQIGTDSSGQLWIVANDKSSTSDLLYILSTSFIQICAPLALFLSYFYFVTRNRTPLERRRAAREKLQEIMPDLPVYESSYRDPQRATKRSFWLYIGMMIVVFSLIFTDLSSTSRAIIFVGIFVLWSSGATIFRSFDKSLTSENREYLRRNGIIAVLFAVIMLLVPILITNAIKFPSSPMGSVLSFVTFIGTFYLTLIGVINAPNQIVYRLALARAKYDRAEAWTTRLLKISSKYSAFVGLKAVTNFYRGDLETARPYYQQLLEEVQNCPPSTLAMMLSNLSLVEENNEQKLHLLEEAVKLYPESSIPYRHLALFYLDQKIYPERALEATDAMMNFAPGKPLIPPINLNYTWYIVLIVRAWALANVGRFEEANDLLNRVMDVMGDNFYPVNAWIYTIAGNIKQLESQIEDAQGYYQRAVTLDPNGLNGRQAAQALSDLSSTAD